MTDRELLELAAKAAGYDYRPEISDIAVGGIPGNWNPLDDDGDALRLAVQMRFNIEHMPPDAGDGPCVFVSDENHRDLAWVEFDGEEQRRPATRRAIVQAAAEIGRNMP
ncbi:hypothetical protein H0A70_07815 [Alcaligenaceae bacterium]|nr:hypothetical protein [Alcaligenaceae bacterium]